jgi:hypothetical protein
MSMVMKKNTEFGAELRIYTFLLHILGSRDSTAGIATSYGLDGRGLGVRVLVAEIF